MTTDKAWKRAANRVLRKSGLRLASYEESGWYYRVTVAFEGETDTTQVWVTEI
jgi:hypothetical protein